MADRNVERPEIKEERSQLKPLPNVPNNPYQDLIAWFDGAWLPSLDPAYVGYQNYVTLQNLRYKDKGLEGVSGYTYSNDDDPSGKTITHDRGIQLVRTAETQSTYYLTHQPSDTNIGGTGFIMPILTSIPSGSLAYLTYATDARPFCDMLTTTATYHYQGTDYGVSGRFSQAPQGQISYCDGLDQKIYGGYENRVGAVFLCETDDSLGGAGVDPEPQDVTNIANNDDSSDDFTWAQGTHPYLIIMTTRPCSSFNFYISSANANVSTLSADYWDGVDWQNDICTETTTSAAKALATSGHVSGHSTVGVVNYYDGYDTTSKPKHFEGLYLYAYRFELSAGSADIYRITANYYFTDKTDIWDGVYRQPIGAFLNQDSVVEDYTLHVNQPSDINTPIGMILDAFDNDDEMYIGFEEPVTALNISMLTTLVNAADCQIDTIYYWDGTDWTSVGSFYDGTLDAADDTSFSQSGTIWWAEASDEKPFTYNDISGYWYKISMDGTVTDDAGGKDPDSEDVVVDLITGVPAIKELDQFEFSTLYKDRLMLCNAQAHGSPNRVDYCATNAPNVWNGYDSSNDGLQSVYFGTETEITGAQQLYNRFGSTIFTTLVVFKNNEIYLLTGDSPEDFRIYPISYNIGCPAWQTIDGAEVGFSVTEAAERNVVMFLSHAGPMMFDGAVIIPIKGIENYFDPNESECVNFDYIDTSEGWYDSTYHEYNLLLPSGSATTPNKWLVYDLVRKRWFEKNVGTATIPTAITKIKSDTGNIYYYAPLANRYQVRLEYGTSWGGTGITYKVKTGDFWPTNNFWDETRIRKFKLICHRIQESHSVSVDYYGDTAESSGIGVAFVDSDDNDCYFTDDDTLDTAWAAPTATTLDLSAATGLQRLVTINSDLNRLAWAHAFEFSVTTDDTTKGFRPIGWGIEYQVIRKDNTAD